MLRFIFLLFGLFMSFTQVYSQGKVIIEGYVYEENDRGFIGDAEVKLFTSQMISVSTTITDEYGHFIFETTDDRKYVVRASKKIYFQKEVKVDPAGKNDANKVFVKMMMEREPGYVFDVTLAEPRPAPDAPTNSVDEATIEIYNNTTKKMEWVAEAYPSPYFKFTFQQGNHYTIVISKKRYITKQIEAYVNVNGCIVCIEGVDNVKPGVVDNLTAGHQKGTLLANIELRPIKIGEKIPIENLYYDSGKYLVKKSMHKTLGELIVLMENNPSLIVELRSHTDCKGDAKFNGSLSLKRANAAVKHILSRSNIDKFRIKGVGMGESSPVSKCKDCGQCTDKQLARNRRTELVITGLLAQKESEKLPLTKKVEAIRMEELLQEVMGGEQIQIPAGGKMPDDLKKQIEQEGKGENKPTKRVEKETPKVSIQESSTQTTEPTKEIVEAPAQEVTKNVMPKPKSKKKVEKEINKKNSKRRKKRKAKDVEREKQIEEARRRAAKAYEGKTAVAQDPGVSDLEGRQEDEVGGFDASPVVVYKKKIVSEVNLSDMDISKRVMQLPEDYTGYKVEVKQSTFELPLSDIIFSTYSEVVYYKGGNGKYIYLTGDYATRTVADVGLKYARKETPKAKLHLFRLGRMVD